MIYDCGSFKCKVVAQGEMVAIVFTIDDRHLYRGYCRSIVNLLENKRKFPSIMSVSRQEEHTPIVVTVTMPAAHYSKECAWEIINLFVARAISYELMMAYRN